MATETKEVIWVKSEGTLGSVLDAELVAGWTVFYTANESTPNETKFRFLLER
jgi:hypothetical protein